MLTRKLSVPLPELLTRNVSELDSPPSVAESEIDAGETLSAGLGSSLPPLPPPHPERTTRKHTSAAATRFPGCLAVIPPKQCLVCSSPLIFISFPPSAYYHYRSLSQRFVLAGHSVRHSVHYRAPSLRKMSSMSAWLNPIAANIPAAVLMFFSMIVATNLCSHILATSSAVSPA